MQLARCLCAPFGDWCSCSSNDILKTCWSLILEMCRPINKFYEQSDKSFMSGNYAQLREQVADPCLIEHAIVAILKQFSLPESEVCRSGGGGRLCSICFWPGK